jgi:plastocyanin
VRAAVRCLALSSLATGIATATSAGAAERAITHRVVIEGLKYVPETLVVHRGDTVVWINKDPFPHTATAAAAFDSGSLGAGRSWRFVARRAGTFSYVCTLHSTMKGTLRVE